MATPSIESVVQQLQATATQASGRSSENVAQANFGEVFKAALNQISESEINARAQAQDFERGKEGISINDVMVNLQKSNVSLQMGIQERNKLISAYSEIMNMQI